jgi:hypothetical protein
VSWCLSGEVEVAVQEDRCTIGLWRGYVSALFYARPIDRNVAMMQGSAFRTWRWPWRKPVPLWDDPAAKASLVTLEQMLSARGWTRTREQGTDWYELTFIRDGRADNGRSNARSRVPKNGQRSPVRAPRNKRAPLEPQPVILSTAREGKGVRRDTGQ